MEIQLNVITGVNVGIEYFEDEDHGNGVILDLVVLRLIFFFNPQD